MPFATFRDRVERGYYGFVITAHPTFSLSQALRQRADGAGRDARGRQDRTAGRAASQPRGGAHVPDPSIDLALEHRQSLDALRNLQTAVSRIYDIVLEVAAELYPEDWRSLSPKLLTIASWVGYDTDGRADIAWTAIFAKRLRVKLAQLERYRGAGAGPPRSLPSRERAGLGPGAGRGAPGARHPRHQRRDRRLRPADQRRHRRCGGSRPDLAPDGGRRRPADPRPPAHRAARPGATAGAG